jgi:hypothetical protein
VLVYEHRLRAPWWLLNPHRASACTTYPPVSSVYLSARSFGRDDGDQRILAVGKGETRRWRPLVPPGPWLGRSKTPRKEKELARSGAPWQQPRAPVSPGPFVCPCRLPETAGPHVGTPIYHGHARGGRRSGKPSTLRDAVLRRRA